MPYGIINRRETYHRKTVLAQDSRLAFLGRLFRHGESGLPASISPVSRVDLKGKAMKYDIGSWAVVVFMSFLMVGCSSIRARNETPDKKWTVYPGIQRDVKETLESAFKLTASLQAKANS